MSRKVRRKSNRLGRHLSKQEMIDGRGFTWADFHHYSHPFWEYLNLRIAQAIQEPLKDHLVQPTK